MSPRQPQQPLTLIQTDTVVETVTHLNDSGALTFQVLPAVSVINFSATDATPCATTCFNLTVVNLGREILPGSWKLFFRDLTRPKATEYLCNSTLTIEENQTVACGGALALHFRAGDILNVEVIAPNGAKAIGRVQHIAD